MYNDYNDIKQKSLDVAVWTTRVRLRFGISTVFGYTYDTSKPMFLSS